MATPARVLRPARPLLATVSPRIRYRISSSHYAMKQIYRKVPEIKKSASLEERRRKELFAEYTSLLRKAVDQFDIGSPGSKPGFNLLWGDIEAQHHGKMQIFDKSDKSSPTHDLLEPLGGILSGTNQAILVNGSLNDASAATANAAYLHGKRNSVFGNATTAHVLNITEPGDYPWAYTTAFMENLIERMAVALGTAVAAKEQEGGKVSVYTHSFSGLAGALLGASVPTELRDKVRIFLLNPAQLVEPYELQSALQQTDVETHVIQGSRDPITSLIRSKAEAAHMTGDEMETGFYSGPPGLIVGNPNVWLKLVPTGHSFTAIAESAIQRESEGETNTKESQ